MDKEIAEQNTKGIYIGNYFKWDANSHVKLVIEKYGWKPAEKAFERTYRKFSNLDDRYENGIHDLMKFIKFGYGRCSDHASKDIRMGYMTREEGIKMVKKYDHVKPKKDLNRWLEYVNMSMDEFDTFADTLRDKRVWKRESNGDWVKDNIWSN